MTKNDPAPNANSASGENAALVKTNALHKFTGSLWKQPNLFCYQKFKV